MEKITVKYAPFSKGNPPQPIRMKPSTWGGPANIKMQDGSEPQPWHCLPFVEGSTYGLELTYPYENECHVHNDDGKLRFEWDFAKEPGGEVTGGEFISFYPKENSKFYLFNTRIDIQSPPGYVLRTEPHPRFFTDDTGEVPISMIGHLQAEWYPRKLFVVFKAPFPGQKHVFRKGDPIAQILFVPQRMRYDLVKMTPEEEAARRELEHSIETARLKIADNIWRNAAGADFNNHYKLMARAFGERGVEGVKELVHAAEERQLAGLPPEDKSTPDLLAAGAERLGKGAYNEAKTIYTFVLNREPDNAEALSKMGICVACTGSPWLGVKMMTRATEVKPNAAIYHSDLGEMYRMLGKFQEAEQAFRNSLRIGPPDLGVMSALGLTIAQQGRPAEGLEMCRNALKINPKVAPVHFRIGLILAQQGDRAAARASYQTALELDPNYAPAQRSLAELDAAKT